MREGPLKFQIRNELFDYDRIQISMAFRQTRTNDLYVAQPIKFVGIPQGHTPPEPAIHLEREEAQLLMDQLWDVGLRPSEGTGSAGSMAAVQRHLEDMRTLVFEKTVVHGKAESK